MIRNSNCATKIAESQRTWKQNHLFLKREPFEIFKICEICEICEPFKTRRKISAKIRERKAQDGNNLRRNWFIGGCPINWRRPTLPHSHAVPSARTDLTALFGMGRGVPRGYNRHCLFEVLGIFYTHQRALTN